MVEPDPDELKKSNTSLSESSSSKSSIKEEKEDYMILNEEYL